VNDEYVGKVIPPAGGNRCKRENEEGNFLGQGRGKSGNE